MNKYFFEENATANLHIKKLVQMTNPTRRGLSLLQVLQPHQVHSRDCPVILDDHGKLRTTL